MTPLEKAQSALKKQKKKNKNKFGFDQKELQVITRKSNKTSVAQSHVEGSVLTSSTLSSYFFKSYRIFMTFVAAQQYKYTVIADQISDSMRVL